MTLFAAAGWWLAVRCVGVHGPAPIKSLESGCMVLSTLEPLCIIHCALFHSAECTVQCKWRPSAA